MKAILDTSVLIGDSGPTLTSDHELAISVVSLSELHFGVLVAANEAERARRLHRLSLIEHTFLALPVTDRVARVHGAMSAHVRSIGRQPRPRAMDLVIAATAASSTATLLTHNLADFAGLEDFVDVARPA